MDQQKTQNQPPKKPHEDLRVHSKEALRCPFCHEGIQLSERKSGCPECMAWHHEACWQEHGQCASCGATLDANDSSNLISDPSRPPQTLNAAPSKAAFVVEDSDVHSACGLESCKAQALSQDPESQESWGPFSGLCPNHALEQVETKLYTLDVIFTMFVAFAVGCLISGFTIHSVLFLASLAFSFLGFSVLSDKDDFKELKGALQKIQEKQTPKAH